jgi:hypothetical protein
VKMLNFAITLINIDAYIWMFLPLMFVFCLVFTIKRVVEGDMIMAVIDILLTSGVLLMIWTPIFWLVMS